MFNLFPAKRFFRVNPTGVRFRRTLVMAIVLPLLLFGIREPLSQARTLQVKERPIVYGAPIEQALEGRQVHTYQLDLNEGQYVRIIVEQRGVDVVVALRSADGALIYEVDSPNGTAGTEEIPYVVKRSGRYLVTVASFDEKAPVGKYEIRLSELRSATEQDEYLSAGERAEAEADRLYRRRDATLLRQAQGKSEEAARAWRLAGKPGKEADAIYLIAFIYESLGEPEKGLEFLERALPLYREAQDTVGMAKTIGALGVSWSNRGEHQKALGYLYEVRSLLKDTGNILNLAPTLSSIATILSILGETQKAFQTYEEALDLLRTGIATTKDEAIRNTLRITEAQLLGNVCVARGRTGEWQQALDACNQALPVLRELKEARLEGMYLNRAASALTSIGELERAMKMNLESLRLLEQVGDRRNQAITLNDIGLIYYDEANYAKAVEYYNQSIRLAKEAGNPGGQAVTFRNLGAVHAALGEPEKSKEYLEQALELFRTVGDRQGEANTLIALGNLTARLGNSRRAAETFQEALQLSRAIRMAPQEANALLFLARTSRELGDLNQALTYGEEGLRLTESLRTNVISRDQRSAFFSTVQDRYDSHIETLMQLHRQRPNDGFAQKALDLSERARARGLLELLAESNANIQSGLNPVLLAKERALRQQLNSKAEAQTRFLSRKQTEAKAEPIAREINELTVQLKDVEAEIRRSSPRYASLVLPEPLKTGEIQKELLDDQTLLLEYALGEKASYLWVLSPTTISAYQLPPRKEIETAAKKVYELITARQSSAANSLQEIQAADEQFPGEATRLSKLLLGPAASQLENKRLLVVGSGILEYLPFGLLSSPGASVPLIAEHEIITLPSASALGALRREMTRKAPAAEAAAVFADPVFTADDPRIAAAKKSSANGSSSDVAIANGGQGSMLDRTMRDFNFAAGGRLSRLTFSRREAEALLSYAPGTANLKAMSFEANRQRATSADLGRYRILHFATHGLLNSEHPELSGLVLSLVDSTGKSQDGFLRLHDIYDLKLNAEVVVLSACQTGLGKQVRGEGLVGLTRGFMYAGAPRIVASLWQVNDVATAELMKHFYHGLFKEGLRPAAALRSAQLELMKQKRWASPYYWAPFVLQGEWK